MMRGKTLQLWISKETAAVEGRKEPLVRGREAAIIDEEGAVVNKMKEVALYRR
jgi:hypothetical protein